MGCLREGGLRTRGVAPALPSPPHPSPPCACPAHRQAALDHAALDLQPFYAGALVRWSGAFHRVADPLRHPLDGLGSLPNPIGTPLDKLRVGLFRVKSLLGSLEDQLRQPEMSIQQRLQVGLLRGAHAPHARGLTTGRGGTACACVGG